MEEGKRERLRSGEAVELKPGIHGRLNKINRTLELDSGKILPIGQNEQRDLFPENEAGLDIARRTEKLESQVKKAPFGEFLHQFGQSGIMSAPKDWLDYFTKTGDQYLKQKEAQRRVTDRISGESPITSGLATAASFIPEIALTSGMSAAKAAPLLTTASAGPRIIQEPQEVAKEALISGIGGKLIDVGTNTLNRIASGRGEIRGLPAQQEALRNQNIIGQQAVNEANILQGEEHNLLKQKYKNFNEMRLQNHQNELLSRQNKILQEENAFKAAKHERDTEVLRLKNDAEVAKAQRHANKAQAETEYKIAKDTAKREDERALAQFKVEQEEYQKALKEMPSIQKKAQEEYSAKVVSNAEKISEVFPKESKIFSSQFGVGEFIEDSINKSALAGSREANQASKALESLFPQGEILAGKDLANRYKALEGLIQKSKPEVSEVLNEFKIHMGSRLNSILADNLAYTRVIPTFQKQVEKSVNNAIQGLKFDVAGLSEKNFISKMSGINLNRIFRELSPQDFINKLRSGEIRQNILKNVLNPHDFGVNIAKSTKSSMARATTQDLEKMGVHLPNPAQVKYEEFINSFMPKLDDALAKAELKMIAVEVDAATKLGGKVKNTYGSAENVRSPIAPTSPSPVPSPTAPPEFPDINPVNFPAPVSPPVPPPLPSKPFLLEPPNAPNAQSFIPQSAPELSPPQGIAGGAAKFLEKDLMGGKGLMNNPVTKLAGLKYLLGPAALPAEAAYAGMKGLTSPTATGEALRMSFKQGGIQAIDSWAQKYPSYQNGVLQDPQERRSLTKEIEDDPEIPLEQKAIIQSKINRGKNLQQKL